MRSMTFNKEKLTQDAKKNLLSPFLTLLMLMRGNIAVTGSAK